MLAIIGSIVGLIAGVVFFFLTNSLYVNPSVGDLFAISAAKVFVMFGYALFLAIVGGIIGSMLLVTHQKQANVIEFLGKFHSVKNAGLSIKPPSPLGIIVGSMSLQIMQLSMEIGVKSNDNAFLKVPVKVQYKVIEAKVKEAFYELRDASKQITSYIENFVRSQANSMNMDEIFSSKNEFKEEIQKHLTDKFAQFGFEIIDVLVDDPQPSDELKRAFDKVLAAKRDQEASELEKMAIKNRIVGKAAAEAESLELKAAAYVNVRKTMAKGNSAAIKEFCEGLEVTHGEALAYFAGLDSRDAIRDAAQGNGSVIVIPTAGLDGGAAQIGMMSAIDKALAHKKEENKS